MPQKITIFNSEKETIDNILKEFLKNSGAKGTIFADLSGVVLSKQGFIQKYDVNLLTVLSANAATATRQMAAIVGENTFKELIFNGKRQNIYVTFTEESGIFITIFDNTTTLGLIRLYADKAAAALEKVYLKIKERSKAAEPSEIERKLPENNTSKESEKA